MSSSDGRAGRSEQPAVKTTIVGGRPPGSGKGVGEIPRGIEVLVKKASVDAEFRALLLERRSRAAADIGLTLEPAEAMMLDAVPAGQLEAIIAHTEVSPQRRRAFLGRAAAVMLAALGAAVAPGCDEVVPAPKGIRPDPPPKSPEPKTKTLTTGTGPKPVTRVPVTDGIRPDPPPKPAPPVTEGIRPDRPPAVSRGISFDRPPAKPDSKQPAIDPATAQPTPPAQAPVTKGIRPDRPKPRPDAVTRGVRPDRP